MKVVQRWLPDRNFRSPDPKKVNGKKVRVPSVAGLNIRKAQRRLRKRGLVARTGPMVDSSYPRGTVAYVRPGAGSGAGSGTAVTLYVSDGTPYVPPPPPKPEPKPDPKPDKKKEPKPPKPDRQG